MTTIRLERHELEMLKPFARRLKELLPDKEHGFAVLLFDFVAPGATFYASSTERESTVAAIKEFYGKCAAANVATGRKLVAGQVDDETFASQAFRIAMQDCTRRMVRVIKMFIEEPTEFLLLTYDVGAGGSIAYLTSIPVSDMLTRLGDWLASMDGSKASQRRS